MSDLSDVIPEKCGKCGRVVTDKNMRSFVQDLWQNPPIWRCNDLRACAKRILRKEVQRK